MAQSLRQATQFLWAFFIAFSALTLFPPISP
jgi:hypothetical protein